MKKNIFLTVFFSFVAIETFAEPGLQKDEKYPNGSIKVRWTEVKNARGAYVKEGTQTEYYQNGMKKRISNLKNGQLEGESQLFSKNSELVAKESYEKGSLKIDGESFKYYANGDVMSACKVNGRCVGYFPNKKISFVGSMKNGKRDGEFSFFYSTGELKFKGICRDKDSVGPWRAISRRGHRIEFAGNGVSKIAVSFPESEKRINYVDEINFRKVTHEALAKLSEFDFGSKVELNDRESCELARFQAPCVEWSEFDCSFDLKGLE